MSEHIVKSFEEQMQALSAELLRMGMLARDQLASAIDALERRDIQLAERVRKNDKQIDAMHADIEEQVMTILALRNPMAVDLRETVAALNIAHGFERIGDLAKNTTKRSQIIIDYEPIKGIDKIIEMGRLAVQIVDDVITAYQERSGEKAVAVWQADQKIDAYCNDVFHIVLSGMMTDNSNVNACTQMTFVAKNLERIGDHATNIAESVHFVIMGEKIEDRRPKKDHTSSMAVPETDAG